MARRRSVVRRAGAGWKITPGLMLAVLLVVGGLVMVGFKVGLQPGFGQQAVRTGDDAAAVVGRAATAPAREGEGFFQRLGGMWSATARVQQLEAENRELRARLTLTDQLAERNKRYEELLGMPSDAFGSAGGAPPIAAQLVLDAGGPFTRTLLANAGADHGVKVGYIAVNENGLIGRVVSVGRRSARVLMLDDYNSRIPVMGEASRVRAVMAGQATSPPDLMLGPYSVQSPRLDFIVGAQSLREGERLVTSGDGGIYPRGLAVGVAHRDGDKWRVQLAASQQPIDFVRIIPYVGAETPEGAPVPDAGPPASLPSAVAAIGRDTMAPPPAPLRSPTPRPPVTTQAQAVPANAAPPRLRTPPATISPPTDEPATPAPTDPDPQPTDAPG